MWPWRVKIRATSKSHAISPCIDLQNLAKVAEVWSKFWSWSLVKILKLKSWFQSLSKLLLWTMGNESKHSMPWVRCAFANQWYIMQPRRQICSPYDDVDCLLLPRKKHWFSEFSKSTSHESCLLRFHCISRYPGLSSTRFAETQLAKMRTLKWLWW